MEVAYIIGFASGVLAFVVIGKVRLWLQSRSEELERKEQEKSRQQGVEQAVEYDALCGAKDIVRAPLEGAVYKLLVEDNTAVRKGDVVLIFESRKMEIEIKAPVVGYVKFYQPVKSTCPKDAPLFAVM